MEVLPIFKSDAGKERSGVSGALADFVQSAVYSGVQRPLDGVTQLAGKVAGVELHTPVIAERPGNNNWATSAGSITGAVADIYIISKGVSYASSTTGFERALAQMPAYSRNAALSATVGTLFGLTSPVERTGNYWANKGRDVATTAGVFTVMGGLGAPLEAKFGTSFLGRVSAGAVGGAGGGVTSVALTDLLYWQKPNLGQLKEIGRWTAIGAAGGAIRSAEEFVKPRISELFGKEPMTRDQSIATHRAEFERAIENKTLVQAEKLAVKISIRRVTSATGELISTIEKPAGQMAAPGEWVLTRLNSDGTPFKVNGIVNQWPSSESGLNRAYEVPKSVQDVGSGEVWSRPGFIGRFVKLDKPAQVVLSNGDVLKGKAGDFVFNRDFNAAQNAPGTKFSIVAKDSFDASYKPIAKRVLPDPN